MEEAAYSWIAFHGFTPHVVVLCAVTLFLLSISALVSGSETSFFSLSHNDIRQFQKSRSPRAAAVLRMLSDVDLLLATILVVNNLVNICIVILTAGIIDSLFTFLRFEFLFKTVLVTFLLLLFGEILPKVLAQTMPVRFALMVARPLSVLRWIFYPLSYLLVHASSRISEKAAHKSEISLDELADAVDMTQSSSPEEHEMLSGIVNFVNTEVQEIMKPRVDMTALDITDDYDHVKHTIIESGFSRIPVYEEDMDNIRGTLYVKDLLPYINNGKDFAWQQLMRKPYFVPEHKKINDLLADFQTNKVHMAIVVDEYGSTLGLVSLEDIIEEIVGEISDESDNEETFYTRLDAKTYLFEGKTHLGDFERILELDEDTFADVKGEADTLAGLMLELKRDFPRKGDTFLSHGIRFTVQEMEGHRIDKIRVDLP
ncbi:gliding motility-associated protein GldE [Alistipes sp. An54]|uniref:gliding motility-associated protein GldE n=1 Tax=Alistipes sp. An54 TaxID=1965645 RepID=UPI000B39F16D|nr:gliding motility-associated protein GldE [Alistipes sp. An54]OUN76734.1 gliding motility-associated protein GldE [Alistipes sp. An54]